MITIRRIKCDEIRCAVFTCFLLVFFEFGVNKMALAGESQSVSKVKDFPEDIVFFTNPKSAAAGYNELKELTLSLLSKAQLLVENYEKACPGTN